MTDRERKLLWDALRAIDVIVARVGDRAAAAVLADASVRDGIERQLIIVGEALARLRQIAPDRFATVPRGSQVVGLRNILVHNYDDIDAGVLAAALELRLPELREAICEMLGD